METDDFEWDDNKAASNLAKHHITFEKASFAFDDPDGLHILDDTTTYREERFKLVGWSGQWLLAVIYTERGEKFRIISAREADHHERTRYNLRRGP